MASLQQDETGLLWVLLTVPDAQWTRARTSKAETGWPAGTNPYSIDELNSYFDTVVEVLDPRSGEVLASLRHRSLTAGGIFGDGLIATRRQDADGFLLLDIWRLGLAGRRE